MKSYNEFREENESNEPNQFNEELERKVIVVRKKGMGWEARFPAVDTTLGVGQDPIEAVKNLWTFPNDTGEDWEREDRKHRYTLGMEDRYRRNQGPAV